MNKVLETIELCNKKMKLFNVNQAKLGNEIRNFVNLKKLNTNLTTKEMYYDKSSVTDDILINKIDIIIETNFVIDYIEKLINDSEIKKYISVILHAYIEDFYNACITSNYYKNNFNKNLFSNVKKLLKKNDFNIIVDSFFKISKEVIDNKKQNPNVKFADNIMYAWLFYLLLFIDKYDESMGNFNKIFLKESLESLNEIKVLATNNEYISKRQIKELDNKCGKMATIYNMSEEYNILINEIKKYNSSFIKKEDVKPEILISPKKQDFKPLTSEPIIPRTERMRLYQAKKNKSHPYIDEESPLNTDEIEFVSAYVEIVLEESISDKFDIDEIIDEIPEKEFNSEISMLKEIISRLKLNNINSNTNKVLIKLNAILKGIIIKKKSKKK